MFPFIVKTALEKKTLQHLLPGTTVKQNLVKMLFEDITKKDLVKILCNTCKENNIS